MMREGAKLESKRHMSLGSKVSRERSNDTVVSISFVVPIWPLGLFAKPVSTWHHVNYSPDTIGLNIKLAKH